MREDPARQNASTVRAKMRHEILIEKDVLNVLRDAFCVELRPFYCSKRISVPMSYITCLDISLLYIIYNVL